MAEGKKSFVLYTDQGGVFNKLTDEQAGKLIKHIFSYCSDEHPEGDFVTELAFELIKQQLKRDLDKWGTTREGRSKAGKASAEARKVKKEQESTNPTSVESVQQSSTNPTVNVNGNVTVNVTDNVNDNKQLLMSEANASNVTEANKIYFPLAEAFYILFKKNESALDVKWNHLKKCTAKNFIDPVRLMIEIDERSEADIILVGNFLKADEFWMPNIQSTSKLREKFDQLITKAKTNGRQGQSINERAAQFLAKNDPDWKNY